MKADLEGEGFPDLLTKDVTVLSSLHGRQRREERGILKSQLQEAVKHGKCERANPGRNGQQRWKFTHNGCVYVTDASRRHEITSWKVERRDLQIVTDHDSGENEDTRSVGSHIVLLVDASGSMNKKDVPGYSTRTEAVYDTLVKDFMQPQLEHSLLQKRLVTLIEMSETARVVFERQTLNGRLCQMVNQRKRNRARSHGNYLPALDAVRDVLLADQQNQYQLFVVFLSDGAPSDHTWRQCEHGVQVWKQEKGAFRTCQGDSKKCQQTARRDVHSECFKKVTELGNCFGLDRMYLATVAFGPQHEDFTVLRKMAEQLPRSSFQKLGLSASLLHTHLTSLTGTLTTFCTEVMSQNLTIRTLRFQDIDEPTVWTLYRKEHVVECLRRNKAYISGSEPGFVDAGEQREGDGIQIARLPYEKGAEWVVSRCRELVGTLPIGRSLVAKQPLHEELLGTEEFFHKSCRVQSDAQKLADLFNRRLRLDDSFNVSFVGCLLYKLRSPPCVEQDQSQPERPGDTWYKVEEEITGLWTKWNDNSGRVVPWYPPQSAPLTPAFDDALQDGGGGATVSALEAILEDVERGDERKAGEPETRSPAVSDKVASWPGFDGAVLSFDQSLVPQCFSHFSNTVTEGRQVVCDLQGTWNSTDGFILTDPVIHYAGDLTGRRRGKNGRTDKGLEGIRLFFLTHTCNALCHRLGLETPERFLVKNAILDFFTQRQEVGKRQLAGWTRKEIMQGTRSVLASSRADMALLGSDFSIEFERLLQSHDVICTRRQPTAVHPQARFLTVELHAVLYLTGVFFATWRELCVQEGPDEIECARSEWGQGVEMMLTWELTKRLTTRLSQTLTASITSMHIDHPNRLRELGKIIFNFAVVHPTRSQDCANLCAALLKTEKFRKHWVFYSDGIGQITFKRCLLGFCRDVFECVFATRARPQPQGNVEGGDELDIAETQAIMLGCRVIKFLSCLYVAGILNAEILLECAERLPWTSNADWVLLLCQLVITAGKTLYSKASGKDQLATLIQQVQRRSEDFRFQGEGSHRVREIMTLINELKVMKWTGSPKYSADLQKRLDEVLEQIRSEGWRTAVLYPGPCPPTSIRLPQLPALFDHWRRREVPGALVHLQQTLRQRLDWPLTPTRTAPLAGCSRAVESRGIEKPDEEALRSHETLSAAEKHKENGSRLVQVNEFEEALLEYERALELAGCVSGQLQWDEVADSEMEELQRHCEQECWHCLVKLERYDQALAKANRVVALTPANNAAGLYLRGKTYALLAWVEEAIAELERVVELDPEHPQAQLLLAQQKEEREFDQLLELERHRQQLAEQRQGEEAAAAKQHTARRKQKQRQATQSQQDAQIQVLPCFPDCLLTGTDAVGPGEEPGLGKQPDDGWMVKNIRTLTVLVLSRVQWCEPTRTTTPIT